MRAEGLAGRVARPAASEGVWQWVDMATITDTLVAMAGTTGTRTRGTITML